MKYSLGTKITGTFEGTVVATDYSLHPNVYIAAEEKGSFYNVHLDKVTVTGRELPEPVDWPPRKGDLWRVATTGTVEFFATVNTNGEILLIPDDNEISDTWTVEEFKHFNPRLIRRKQ